MLFNISKCRIMHFGRHNFKTGYEMGDQQLDVVKVERDLGVLVQDDLKVSQQCIKAVKTAN